MIEKLWGMYESAKLEEYKLEKQMEVQDKHYYFNDIERSTKNGIANGILKSIEILEDDKHKTWKRAFEVFCKVRGKNYETKFVFWTPPTREGAKQRMAMFSKANLEAVGITNNQDKIQYLKRFQILNREIDRKYEAVLFWRNKLEKATPTYTTERKGGGTIYGNTEEIIAKIVDLENRINVDIDRLIDLKAEISEVIEAVKDAQERLLLRYRYIDGKTFEEIAVMMEYSWRHIHRLHSQALSSVEIATMS